MKWWTAFVERFARREPALPLALVRLALGMSLLVDLVATWWSGAATAVWMPVAAGGWHDPGGGHWLVKLLGGPTAGVVDGLLALTIAATVAFVIGLGSQPAALITLVGSQALFSLNPGAGGGHDRVFLNGLWLLVFARSDATLSLGCRLRTGQWTSEEPVPAWPRTLVVWQIVLMYVSTGLSKVSAEWWPSGGYNAVYYALQYPPFARFDPGPWLGRLHPLTQVGTALTIPFEVGWPVALLWRPNGIDLRLVWVGLGLVVHGTLWAFLDLGPFAQVTLSLYFALFTADEYKQAWATLRRAAPAATR